MSFPACALDFQWVRGRVTVRQKSRCFPLLDHGALCFLLEQLLRSFLDEDRNEVTDSTLAELPVLLLDDLRDMVALESWKPLGQTVDYLVNCLSFVELAHGDILVGRRSPSN